MNKQLTTWAAALSLVLAFPLASLAQHPAAGMTPATTVVLQKPGVITKTVSAGELQKALHKAGKGPLEVEVYPVKKSADGRKNDFDALVLLRDAHNTSYVDKSVSNNAFDKQAGQFVDYYKQQRLPKEKIPYGYRATIDKSKAKGSLAITVEPAIGRITLKYTAGFGSVCDSCKCPPQCSGGTGQPLAMAARMERILNASYVKK